MEDTLMKEIRPDITDGGTHPSVLIDHLGEAMLAIEEAVDAIGRSCPRVVDYEDKLRFSFDHREHWRRVGVLTDMAHQYRCEARAAQAAYKAWRSAVAAAV
jgi:hypothetical protein